LFSLPSLGITRRELKKVQDEGPIDAWCIMDIEKTPLGKIRRIGSDAWAFFFAL